MNEAHDPQLFSKERVLLLGSQGYLGQQFQALYPKAITPKIDIANTIHVREAIQAFQPVVVINCAGRCGAPNVDWCEDHKLETLHSNVIGALVLMEECLNERVFLVHISSGCIYTGDNGGEGYSEDDAPNFGGSFYSRTKLWSDQILREFPVLTLRLRMPFDGSLNDRNLLMKLRRYRRVLAAPNSLTCLPDFVRAADELIRVRATGIFNVVNPGLISPFEAMMMYKEIVDPSHAFERLDAENLGEVTVAARSNCVLDTTRLANRGVHLPHVRVALTDSLRSLAQKLAATAGRKPV